MGAGDVFRVGEYLLRTKKQQKRTKIMIKIERNKNLAPFTTLKVGGKAQYFTIVKTKEELFQALDFAQERN